MTRKFPDTLLILMIILLIFVGLTWIIPAGEFDRALKAGREIVVPGTYHRVDPSPQGIGAFFTGPIRGFISAAQIIGFVFLVGGSFNILTRTGAVDAGLQSILRFSQRKPSTKKWIIPLVMILFSLAGATFGMSEETLVFILITIPLAMALGYDSITGLGMAFVGAHIGFAGAFINPFTIGVAQGIADLPPASGVGYRVVVWTILTIVGIVYVMRYAKKVEKQPELSPAFEIDKKRYHPEEKDGSLDFNLSRKLVLLALFICLAILVYGVSGDWGWYINEIAALFIGLGILAAILGRLSADEAISAFKEGAKDMMTAALVIGLAKGLIVVAQDGKIIDTILNGIASVSSQYGWLNVELMFVFQSFLNFFVPSGSGQAALTMPIMAPLSDILEVSRQTAVLAFQFGDGLSNMIIPTSGVLMGVLGVAKIPYNIWIKWMLPFFFLLSAIAAILLILPVFFQIW